MTEDEAKTKWCPHVRVNALSASVLSNRGEAIERGISTTCIGSECMAWRLDVVATCPACDDMVGHELDGKPCIECGGIYQRHGFCGLVGKP